MNPVEVCVPLCLFSLVLQGPIDLSSWEEDKGHVNCVCVCVSVCLCVCMPYLESRIDATYSFLMREKLDSDGQLTKDSHATCVCLCACGCVSVRERKTETRTNGSKVTASHRGKIFFYFLPHLILDLFHCHMSA